ncbi:MAG TPA: hypothetical protein VFQ53_41450 [Kofleriaceae bacterium]|nr:hypothetical protein [Kofleriaceae bacterium]
MSLTTKAFRLSLTAAALYAALPTATADAKPRRVVILDFDGPRTLADSGRSSVVTVIGEQYDVVATKRWVDTKAAVARRSHGPTVWSKASKQAGVDAVIDGYVQEEGRGKVLTVVVTDASTGNELDPLTIKLGSKGFTAAAEQQLRDGLEERLEWIEPVSGGNPNPLPEKKLREMVGAKKPDADAPAITTAPISDDEPAPRKRRTKRVEDVVGIGSETDDAAPRKRPAADDADEGVTEKTAATEPTERDSKPKQVATIETKQTQEQKETNELVSLLVPPEVISIEPKVVHTPRPTPRFRIGGGGYYGSRSLLVSGENPENLTQYSGVPNKGLEVNAAAYPFPTKKIDGTLSGIGFSFGIQHAAGSVVTFDDGEAVGDYTINQNGWNAGIHYRAPLGNAFALDGEVGYGKANYIIVDAPDTFEVPDTSYSFLSAGGHLDLSITERSTVGFGAKYLYMLDTGDISSTDWYGPGRSSGFAIDGNFVVPLPKNLYVRGELSFTRIKTTFDGVGQITEDEGVSDATDSTVNANVGIGITF